VVFEVLPFGVMNSLAACGGFPKRYPHWKWGMGYEQISKRDADGVGRIYEMVVNTDPVCAYLQEINTVTDQKLVMAHVYGHADFLKNNFYFSTTNRKMLDEMVNHATRIRRYALSIIRDEAYYFAPQAATKIINEGWTSYWQSHLMTHHFCQASEIVH